MENNLVVLNYESQLQALKETKKERKDAQTNTNQENRAVHTQTEDVDNRGVLKAELGILKNERDYYMNEYKKKVSECADVHSLRLQVQVLRRQLD